MTIQPRYNFFDAIAFLFWSVLPYFVALTWIQDDIFIQQYSMFFILVFTLTGLLFYYRFEAIRDIFVFISTGLLAALIVIIFFETKAYSFYLLLEIIFYIALWRVTIYLLYHEAISIEFIRLKNVPIDYKKTIVSSKNKNQSSSNTLQLTTIFALFLLTSLIGITSNLRWTLQDSNFNFMDENLFIYTLISCLSIAIAAIGLWLQRQWSCYLIALIFLGLDIYIFKTYIFEIFDTHTLIQGIGIGLSTTIFLAGCLLLLFHPIIQHHFNHNFALNDDYNNILDTEI